MVELGLKSYKNKITTEIQKEERALTTEIIRHRRALRSHTVKTTLTNFVVAECRSLHHGTFQT